MPDYGVDTTDWEPLPWTWAAERLSGGRNYWIVTVSAASRPHAMPVWGVWNDDELRFVFSCGPRSRKAANLAANPQVVVASEDTVECLSVEGRAHPVEGDRRELWIARYLAKYTPLAPDLSADFLRQNVVFEVVPERVLAIIEREEEFATRATRWGFEGD
jgi:Pyridoxamine 5'-phosphate oxidase